MNRRKLDNRTKSINILFQIMSTQGSAQMFYMKQAAYQARKKRKKTQNLLSKRPPGRSGLD